LSKAKPNWIIGRVNNGGRRGRRVSQQFEALQDLGDFLISLTEVFQGIDEVVQL
jgi:hypothetical protein